MLAIGRLSSKLSSTGLRDSNTARRVRERLAVFSLNSSGIVWRKGRDSNPRQGFPCSGLANRRTRPTMRPFRMLAHVGVAPEFGAWERRNHGAKGGTRTPMPCEHYALNVACLPFHHFGLTIVSYAIAPAHVKPPNCIRCTGVYFAPDARNSLCITTSSSARKCGAWGRPFAAFALSAYQSAGSGRLLRASVMCGANALRSYATPTSCNACAKVWCMAASCCVCPVVSMKMTLGCFTGPKQLIFPSASSAGWHWRAAICVACSVCCNWLQVISPIKASVICQLLASINRTCGSRLLRISCCRRMAFFIASGISIAIKMRICYCAQSISPSSFGFCSAQCAGRIRTP